jgi:hypothetical protein
VPLFKPLSATIVQQARDRRPPPFFVFFFTRPSVSNLIATPAQSAFN